MPGQKQVQCNKVRFADLILFGHAVNIAATNTIRQLSTAAASIPSPGEKAGMKADFPSPKSYIAYRKS
jgi:hypothetical protein